MTFQYSKELVERCVKYFKEDHDVDISEEIANEYLESLGNLYRILAKPNDKAKENE